MEQYYLPLKHIHLSLVAFSVLFYAVRVLLMLAKKPIHQHKWAKMLSRGADTLLLISALTLCVIISQYPFVDAWITEKLVCVIAYIILAYISLYRSETLKGRLLTSVGAIGWILIAGKIAVFKTPFILG